MTSIAYDENNPFAKILRGELPSHKIYEDEHSFAFMDIMPRSEGHCLVIPKLPSRNLLDAEVSTLAHLMVAVQKIARAAKTAFNAEGLSIDQFNEAVSGQTVFHLHFHILPRYEGVPLRPHAVGQIADHTLLAEQASAIRAVLEATN